MNDDLHGGTPYTHYLFTITIESLAAFWHLTADYKESFFILSKSFFVFIFIDYRLWEPGAGGVHTVLLCLESRLVDRRNRGWTGRSGLGPWCGWGALKFHPKGSNKYDLWNNLFLRKFFLIKMELFMLHIEYLNPSQNFCENNHH
jgi:hypothetical protein